MTFENGISTFGRLIKACSLDAQGMHWKSERRNTFPGADFST